MCRSQMVLTGEQMAFALVGKEKVRTCQMSHIYFGAQSVAC